VVLVLSILLISIAIFIWLIKFQKVSNSGLLIIAGWYLFSSPALHAIASFQLKIIDAYKELGHATAVLAASSPGGISTADVSYMYKYVGHELLYDSLVVFMPVFMAGLGSWALAKYLDRNVTITDD
jgi:hypothetical protein